MALNKDKLASALHAAIKSELDDIFDPAPDQGDDHRDKFATALGNAISKEVIDHVTANLEIVGVKVDIPPSAVGIPTPPQGGALANPKSIVLNQSNDGTGRVK